MAIKVIETHYDGYRFRSRIEARWAIFFNEMGIQYRYEQEGFDMEGVWYLPDFYLPFFDAFCEIKGQEPTEGEMEKCRRLAVQSGKQVFLIIGPPKEDAHAVIHYDARGIVSRSAYRGGEFAQCRRCPEMFLVFKNSDKDIEAAYSIGHPVVRAYMRENPQHECLDRTPGACGRIHAAFAKAMHARFEHGENP